MVLIHIFKIVNVSVLKKSKIIVCLYFEHLSEKNDALKIIESSKEIV